MSSSDVLSQRCKSSNSSSFENSNLPNLTRYSAEMQSKSECAHRTSELFLFVLTTATHLVTLKVLSKRTHLRTERPSGSITSTWVRMSSRREVFTTKKSNRLKRLTKQPCRPSAYIFRIISQVKRTTKNRLVRSCKFSGEYIFKIIFSNTAPGNIYMQICTWK